MSRGASGTYTLPAGNPVSPGEIIESAWANTTLGDVATALTDSLSRTGLGGMLAPFQNSSGSITAPGITWTAEPTSGWYRKALNEFWYAIGGVDIFGITDEGITLADGLVAEGISSFIIVEDDEPADTRQGEQWFESDTGALYMRYQNPDDTFTWIQVNSSGGDSIPTGVVTAKGDLIVGTASGVVDVLPVGANDEVLVADSAEDTGLIYATIPAILGYTPANVAGDVFTGNVSAPSHTVSAAQLISTGQLSVASVATLSSTASVAGILTATAGVYTPAPEGLRILNDSAFISFYNTGGSDRSGYIQFPNGGAAQFANEEGTGFQWQESGGVKAAINAGGQFMMTNYGGLASVNSSWLTLNCINATHNFIEVNNNNGAGGSLAALSILWASSGVGSIGFSAAGSSFNTSSDARLKDNITAFDNIGALIDAMRPVRFVWKKYGIPGIGFIAQELHKIAPEAVHVGGENYDADPWSIDFAKLVPYLVAEVQALRKRVAALEGN